ncbi:alpha-L-rhamnosidase-related protein [Pedobacter steynii]
MNKLRTILLLVSLGIPSLLSAQDFYTKEQRDGWMAKAETNKPRLTEQIKKPVQLVKLEADDKAFQGWKATPAGAVDQLYEHSFKTQSGTVVDFGEHLTGYYTFTIKESANVLDGPLRFKLTFGEVPAELATPFDPYTGGLSRAWLQDETVTVMELPATITIPRRVAFRYLKIDLLASSGNFDFKITDMSFKAVTAVTNVPAQLTENTDPVIKKIDAVGQATLKECMQTVYEDGPKRDRRLWIGDLYLESIANNYSFKDHDLTKRCLYLIAGLSREDGYLNANVFESPKPHGQAGAPFLFEYSLLFNAALKEYFIATQDSEFVLDLWPVAKRQMDNISKHLDKDGLFNADAAQKDGWWIFVDWRDGLDKQASLQGIMIYTMKETLTLAKLLGKDKEVSQLNGQIDKMTRTAKSKLYDKQTGLL